MTTQSFIANLLAETGLSLRGLAKRCGTSHSTLLRQSEDGFKADTILDMARSLDMPFLELAVQAEVISAREAQAIASAAARPDITSFSDEELAREMLRRAKAKKSSVLNQPINADITNLSDRRRKVTAKDVTEEDLLSEAAYTPEEGETPDRDNY